jgi:hypothetical protein
VAIYQLASGMNSSLNPLSPGQRSLGFSRKWSRFLLPKEQMGSRGRAHRSFEVCPLCKTPGRSSFRGV